VTGGRRKLSGDCLVARFFTFVFVLLIFLPEKGASGTGNLFVLSFVVDPWTLEEGQN